jgi:uncharacterized protein
MVEVELQDVVVRVLADEPGPLPRLAMPLRIVLLREKGADRILPIWVGAFEGDALALELGGGGTPRPLTHDLMAGLLALTGARVQRVAVTRLVDDTFYATVTVATGERVDELDGRPSDALNLAARVEAPIFVAAEVMEASGMLEGGLEEEWSRYRPSDRDLAGPSEFRPLTADLVKALWPQPQGKEPPR